MLNVSEEFGIVARAPREVDADKNVEVAFTVDGVGLWSCLRYPVPHERITRRHYFQQTQPNGDMMMVRLKFGKLVGFWPLMNVTALSP